MWSKKFEGKLYQIFIEQKIVLAILLDPFISLSSAEGRVQRRRRALCLSSRLSSIWFKVGAYSGQPSIPLLWDGYAVSDLFENKNTLSSVQLKLQYWPNTCQIIYSVLLVTGASHTAMDSREPTFMLHLCYSFLFGVSKRNLSMVRKKHKVPYRERWIGLNFEFAYVCHNSGLVFWWWGANLFPTLLHGWCFCYCSMFSKDGSREITIKVLIWRSSPLLRSIPYYSLRPNLNFNHLTIS